MSPDGDEKGRKSSSEKNRLSHQRLITGA